MIIRIKREDLFGKLKYRSANMKFKQAMATNIKAVIPSHVSLKPNDILTHSEFPGFVNCSIEFTTDDLTIRGELLDATISVLINIRRVPINKIKWSH